jgi:1-pyrroline-5-carboxylate dehydrogenase
MSWESRAAVFMKAAELLSGPWRWTVLASTVLGQSKNYFQAEIDASCELIDFLRFNVHFAQQIYEQQPESSKGVWNRMVYRPLEGFVYAVTPVSHSRYGATSKAT